MKAPIVIIGIGELGSEFARGFLRCGHPVYPITRHMDIAEECSHLPSPALVLITVKEDALDHVIAQIPLPWRDKLGLVQNELLPHVWQRHHIKPSVAVVWFEKKPGMALTNILYTPVFGAKADLLEQALLAIQVPTRRLQHEADLLFELARKTLYILTVNICGLSCPVTVSELWEQHQDLARGVAMEVIQILESLCGERLSAEQLIKGMVEGIYDCPHRNCLGRSAYGRLKRALKHAREADIEAPLLSRIFRECVRENGAE